MTALDPITAASPTFINAMRHGMRDGSPLQVMPSRKRWHVVAAIVFGIAGMIVSLWARS